MAELTIVDNVIRGPIRHSVNISAQQGAGSIHDDATASRLGLRGGTVAGSVHMDLFAPLFLEAFGARWWEAGSLSLYFRNATVDREPVRAFLECPPAGQRDVQVKAWIEREDGMLIAEGTASAGNPTEPSALASRDLAAYDNGEYRILEDVRPGDSMGEAVDSCSEEEQARHLAVITENLPFYSGPSPWGGPVLTPLAMVRVLWAKPVENLRGKIGRSVGLFGAIEIRNVNGPLMVGRDYRLTGTVLARGQSPKTEYFWFDSFADDEDGRLVASHRMLLRFMKASSEEYAAAQT